MRLLLDGGFPERNESVLVFGNPGSGKTHMLQAISQEMVRQGRRMLFTTCEMLVQDLLIAKRDLKLSRLIKHYSRYEGMVIDDLGYIRQTREEMEVLFTLLAKRYERGSVLLTSNLPFSKWERIFKDPMTTARLSIGSCITAGSLSSMSPATDWSRHVTTCRPSTSPPRNPLRVNQLPAPGYALYLQPVHSNSMKVSSAANGGKCRS